MSLSFDDHALESLTSFREVSSVWPASDPLSCDLPCFFCPLLACLALALLVVIKLRHGVWDDRRGYLQRPLFLADHSLAFHLQGRSGLALALRRPRGTLETSFILFLLAQCELVDACKHASTDRIFGPLKMLLDGQMCHLLRMVQKYFKIWLL
ncbi:hypothetical protein B0H14DRAFT_3449944 [Mycena olivaceomarginata]|nr:hypothetical protein B0H14DRAFT_3449944 [Mycena olivaceomarginata]